MRRASFCFSSTFLLTGALLAAQPAKDAPKEPTHDGKTLSEWVKQLDARDDAEGRKATAALRTLADHSDQVVEKLLAASIDSATRRPTAPLYLLVELGPATVPTLTRGLWSDDMRLRRACLYVLAELGGDARAAAPSVARLLGDTDETVRIEAARTLGAMGARSAIPALRKLLSEPSVGLRYTAARALVVLNADPDLVLPALISDLKSDDPTAQVRAANVLDRLGPQAAPAVPALVAALPRADPKLVVALADTLGSIGPAAREAIPMLKKKLAADRSHAGTFAADVAIAPWQIVRDPDAAKVLRDHIDDARDPSMTVAALWRIDSGKETISSLTELLKSEKPEIAIAAAGVLGTKPKDAIPLLGKMLAHKDPNVPARAVVAISRLGPAAKEVAEQLRGAMKDESPQIAFWAAVAVCRLDPKPKAVAAVAGYLSDPIPAMRLDAVEVISSLGANGKPAAPRLIVALGDNDEQIRLAAALALWRVEQNPTALATAVERLKSSDSRIRSLAASDIGAVFGADAKSAVPELVKRLFDSFSAVRSTTAESLGRIGPAAKDAGPALLALLEGDEPAFVQSAACEALGLIQPADKDAAIAVLKKKSEHPDPLTRIHAAPALWLIAGDKSGEKEAERALGYRTHHVRITAVELLWRTKQDVRVVPLLVRALEESNLDGMQSENERYMAVRALGRIGSAAKPAVPELLKLVNHHDIALTAAVAEALKAIDPEAAKKAAVK